MSRRFDLTTAELAALDEQLRAEGHDVDDRLAISHDADRQAAPLSPAQERLWFMEQLMPGDPAYHVHALLRLDGHLDVPSLRHSLHEIVQRHEVLRTTFTVTDGGQPVQVVGSGSAPLDIVNLTAARGPEQADEVRRLASEQARQPFDLTRGPLLRAAVLRLEPGSDVLALTAHHIAFDGWSMAVFLHELISLYRAYTGGQESPLAPLPVQYSDFACWQRDHADDPELNGQLSFWCQELADAPEVPSLPFDHSPAPTGSHDGATVPVRLPAQLAAELRQLGRTEGASLFMVLLTGFQLLLARWGNQRQVAVGSPVAGRPRTELGGLIGCFVNTVVLRADLTDDLSFRALLGQVRRRCLSAYANQDFPFNRLVEELRPDRRTGYSPLVQVMFALHQLPLPDIELPGLEVTLLPSDTGAAPFELALTLTDNGPTLEGAFTFQTALFEQATIERLADRLHVLLDAVISDPDRPVSELPLLTATDRRQLARWNHTAASTPPVPRIDELFRQQARRTPAAVALAAGARRITYRELDERSDRLARALRHQGIGPETLAGVYLRRSPELVISHLAVLKAGGAFVPLDPSYPPQRLESMLADCQAPVLITEPDLAGDLPGYQGQVVVVPEGNREPARPAGEPRLASFNPGNLAYVIFTSGSTGRPKGVMVDHRNLANLVSWHNRQYQLAPGDRVAQLAGLSFDASVWETWPPLLAGATLHLAPEEIRSDPRDLQRWLMDQAITVTFVPTPLWELMDGLNWTDGPRPRAVLTGGDRLHDAPRPAQPRLFNHYGPTEGTVVATSAEIGPDRIGPPSIGGPIQNMTAHVLGRNGEELPAGAEGELYLSGAGLARGYWHRPDLTAERFVPSPFVPGERLYRTGDLVRWRADGELAFVGRLDAQLKVRGQRVEPGEIEAVLAQHPAVAQAAVVPQDHPGRGPDLVAHVAATGGEPPAVDELRRFMQERLPQHMVPTRVAVRGTLPRTAAGKIDRKMLSSMAITAPQADRYEPPRTRTEAVVAQVWEEVLGVSPVGIHQAFFDLGGHSLLATQALGRVNEMFTADLPLRVFFEAQTVAGVAQVIESAGVSGAGPLADPQPSIADEMEDVEL